MAKKWFHARTVIEDEDVAEAVDEYGDDFERFEESFEALKWLLARKCDELSGSIRIVDEFEYNLHKQAGDPWAETPNITVLYTYDDDEVIIHGILAEQISDADSDDDG